jgi:hypothetical protein
MKKINIETLLNWNPVSENLVDSQGEIQLKSIRRSDNGNLLGVVGKDRAIVSNRDCVQSIVDLANSLNVPFGDIYANEFNGGGKIHVNFPIPEEKIAGESFQPEIRFTFSHDSSERRKVYFVLSRNACKNVFAGAVQKGEGIFAKFSLNHESNFANRVSNFPSKLKSIHFAMTESIESLQNIQVANPEAILKKIIKGSGKRSETVRNEIENLFRNGRGNKGKTAWDLFNGYTEYLNHSATYKQTEGKDREENRMNRLVNTDVIDFAKLVA